MTLVHGTGIRKVFRDAEKEFVDLDRRCFRGSDSPVIVNDQSILGCKCSDGGACRRRRIALRAKKYFVTECLCSGDCMFGGYGSIIRTVVAMMLCFLPSLFTCRLWMVLFHSSFREESMSCFG
jgi:hypothetical protein